MKLILSEALEKEICGHLEESYPEEGCGLLLGRSAQRKEVLKILKAPNTKGENRERRYLIEPEFVANAEKAAQRENFEILGIYHSHPDHPSRPSEFDRDHAWPWYSYVIVSVEKGEAKKVTSWLLRDDRSYFDEESIERT